MSVAKLTRQLKRQRISNRMQAKVQTYAREQIEAAKAAWVSEGNSRFTGLNPEENHIRLNEKPTESRVRIPMYLDRYQRSRIDRLIDFDTRPFAFSIGDRTVVWWSWFPLGYEREQGTVDRVLELAGEIRQLARQCEREPYYAVYAARTIGHKCDELEHRVPFLRFEAEQKAATR